LHGKYLLSGRGRQILAALSAAKCGYCLFVFVCSWLRATNTAIIAVKLRIGCAAPAGLQSRPAAMVLPFV
jgi:hypothetical protein